MPKSDPNEDDRYLPMMSDWDLNAATYAASHPMLYLKVDVKPIDRSWFCVSRHCSEISQKHFTVHRILISAINYTALSPEWITKPWINLDSWMNFRWPLKKFHIPEKILEYDEWDIIDENDMLLLHPSASEPQFHSDSHHQHHSAQQSSRRADSQTNRVSDWLIDWLIFLIIDF